MDFVNRFSQDFQIKLFMFTPNELKTFFDIHFWLKEESDERKIEETLRKFYPQHFQNDVVVKISKDSAFYYENNNEMQMQQQNNYSDNFQDIIEALYQLLQVFDSPDASKKIINTIIQKVDNLQKGDRLAIDISNYSKEQKQAVQLLLKNLGIIQVDSYTYTFTSSKSIINQFKLLASELVQDLNISFGQDNVPSQIQMQNLKEQERVQSQYMSQERKKYPQIESNCNTQINESNANLLSINDESNYEEDQQFIKKEIINKQQLEENNQRKKVEDSSKMIEEKIVDQSEMIEEITDEDKQQIKQSIEDLLKSVSQRTQFMNIAHLIISKLNKLKEGDTFELELKQFSNKNQIISTLETIGVFNVNRDLYGLFTDPQKFQCFKEMAKKMIKEINEEIQNQKKSNESNKIVKQLNPQFEFDEEKMFESLYLVIQSFESETQSIDQIKFILHKIDKLNEGDKFSLDLSLFSDDKKKAIINLLEAIGIYEIHQNAFQLLTDNSIIQKFTIISKELINDMVQSSSKEMVPEQQFIQGNPNDRAYLTKLAQQRHKTERYANNGQSQAQRSSREQMEEYRNNRRQKDLSKNRFTGQNIMTLERLEQIEEKRYEYINENPSAELPSSKFVTIRDIENMTIAENLQKFGKQALEYTNLFRRQNNLPDLLWNNQLTYIGMKHSKDMGDGLVPFGHDGFNNRVRQITFSQRSVAENVAYCSSGYSNIPKTIVDGWINSPGHRKNMLSNSNVCGIAVYRNSKGLWYFTQLFALKV